MLASMQSAWGDGKQCAELQLHYYQNGNNQLPNLPECVEDEVNVFQAGSWP
jgi:hypothetical protein